MDDAPLTKRQFDRMMKHHFAVSDVVITALQHYAGSYLGKLPHRAAFENEASFVIGSLHRAGYKLIRRAPHRSRTETTETSRNQRERKLDKSGLPDEQSGG